MIAAFQWNETSPSSATTSTSSQAVTGTDPNSTAGILSSSEVENALGLTVIGEFQGGGGGTLDVWIQTLVLGTWYDWLHFKQVANTDSTVKYVYVSSVEGGLSANSVAVSTGTSPLLAADTVLPGPWGESLRLVMKAGSGTSKGTPVKVTILAALPRFYHGR